MAKHLTSKDIKSIINIIEGWNNRKLTWEAICEAAVSVVGKRPTRQSLNSIESIKQAYEVKKKNLQIKGVRTALPGSLKIASRRIEKLLSEIDTLKETNSLLLEKFVKWQYNSYKFGIKEHQLNEQLPPIDRDRTDKKLK